MKKVTTIRENSISDYRPKTTWIKNNKKAWRHAGRGESVRKVNWLNLKITENKEIFRERVNQKIHTRKDEKKESVTNWDWIVNILTSVVEEVCGLEENITKPFFKGRGNEINQMQQEITNWMERRNRAAEKRRARVGEIEEEIWQAREELGAARNRLRRSLRD